MKKIVRRFRIINIDVFIYKMDHFKVCDVPQLDFKLEKRRVKKKWHYYIKILNTMVHESYLFDNIFLLKSLKKSGPVIGDCFTHELYRGQSIYPFVINKIAKETLENEMKEVFVIVNQDNFSSIRGIEKAGFSKFASFKGTRWLWFYLKRQITYFE